MDAPRAYLQWNAVNWVTIVLMAAVGFLIVGMIGSGVRVWKGQANAQSD